MARPRLWHYTLLSVAALCALSYLYRARYDDEYYAQRSLPANDLLQRIHALNDVHIADHEQGMDDNKHCILLQEQSNPDQIRDDAYWWSTLTPQQLRDRRSLILDRTMLYFNTSFDPSVAYGRGRGIVFTAGNRDTLTRLRTTLSMLRSYGCKLPVEIFAFAAELSAAGEAVDLIKKLGPVVFRKIESFQKDEDAWKNVHIKGEAIVRSSFSEVLYLDSDNLPTRDVTFLFKSPLYVNGPRAVFWPDINKDGAQNPFWRMFGVNCQRQDWQIDSGQLLIDKRGQQGMNLAALVLAMEMQRDKDFWFRLSSGDKDTFRYAFYALDIPYTPAPHWISIVGRMLEVAADAEHHQFCGIAMLQYGLSEDEWYRPPYSYSQWKSPENISHHAPPLFIHASLLKHSAGNSPGSLFVTIRRYLYDDTSLAGLDKMDYARGRNYFRNLRGKCLDIWDQDSQRMYKSYVPEQWEFGNIEMQDFKSAWGGALKDFEETFLKHGGLIGGFE